MRALDGYAQAPIRMRWAQSFRVERGLTQQCSCGRGLKNAHWELGGSPEGGVLAARGGVHADAPPLDSPFLAGRWSLRELRQRRLSGAPAAATCSISARVCASLSPLRPTRLMVAAASPTCLDPTGCWTCPTSWLRTPACRTHV